MAEGRQAPDMVEASIVLRGDFNPKIFQPAWFAAEGLLPKSEAEGAKIEIIHEDVTIVNYDGFRMQVAHGGFKISSAQEPYFNPMSDLVQSIFQLLRHTPVTKMGLNTEVHFRFSSEDEWHAFGHRCTPKETWHKVLKRPGMLGITMQGERQDQHQGAIIVRVEPSTLYQPGVYIQVNDHYEIADTSGGCTRAVTLLAERWLESRTMSMDIIHTLKKEFG